MSGFAYLVGAGPWSPGLLTVRGRDVLSLRCDCTLPLAALILDVV